MLKRVEQITATTQTLTHIAGQIASDASAAVDTLKGCREFVTKTVVALTEENKAMMDALTERHTHLMGEFTEMLTRIDETISKLEGSANG